MANILIDFFLVFSLTTMLDNINLSQNRISFKITVDSWENHDLHFIPSKTLAA